MPETPAPEGAGEAAELPPYAIESARSSRSRCRTCNRKIDKGIVRLGILLEGPYGTGYLWHHLTCAAKRRIEDVTLAYEARAWTEGLEVPPIEELQRLSERTAAERAQRQRPPYLERAPTGRSKCRRCGELIEKGDVRVILLRAVEFYGQTRTGPIHVHTGCAAAELRAEDCATERDGFEDAVRANTRDLTAEEVAETLPSLGLG